MGEYELWVGRQTKTHTNTKKPTQINAMTQPGLGAGSSENLYFTVKIVPRGAGGIGNIPQKYSKSLWQ